MKVNVCARTVLIFLLASICPSAGFQRTRTPISTFSPRHHEALSRKSPSSTSTWNRKTISSSRSHQMSRNMWSGDDELVGSDRLKACFPYILPMLDLDQFGVYIYDRIPPLGALDDFVLGPLVNIYHAVPFLGIIFFLALTLGTRGATNMSRGVRFNAQQAAMIDVALVFPELIASGFQEDPLPRYLAEPCANFVYYAFMTAIVYSIYSNLQGKKPNQIPYISNFAEMAVGPF